MFYLLEDLNWTLCDFYVFYVQNWNLNKSTKCYLTLMCICSVAESGKFYINFSGLDKILYIAQYKNVTQRKRLNRHLKYTYVYSATF